jgi:hypothetical protein
MRKTLESLNASLREQSLRLERQEQLAGEQGADYLRLRRTYETQSQSLRKLQFKSGAFKWSLVIAVPVCTGLGIWLGTLVPR